VCALPKGAERAPDTYGELGIRHEDTVAVTENGCEVLTDFPYELEA